MMGHIRSIRGLAAVAALALNIVLTTAIAPPVEAAPEGQISFAVHVTLAPKWLDPGETESAITPFMMLYAMFYFLIDGRAVLNKILYYVPLGPEELRPVFGPQRSNSRYEEDKGCETGNRPHGAVYVPAAPCARRRLFGSLRIPMLSVLHRAHHHHHGHRGRRGGLRMSRD